MLQRFIPRQSSFDQLENKISVCRNGQISSGGGFVVGILPVIISMIKTSPGHMLRVMPGVVVFAAVVYLLLAGLFVFDTMRKKKMTNRLQNLRRSYLLVSDDKVEGTSFTSMDEAPTRFSVPMEKVNKAGVNDMGSLNLVLITEDGTYRCLLLEQPIAAAKAVNERRRALAEQKKTDAN